MKPCISFKKIWSDDDMIELELKVCDGKSTFCNQVYVGNDELGRLVKSLTNFRDQIYGGLRNIEFGSFGPEYGNGAFHARFHFPKPGKLFISTNQQSEYVEFKNREVASEAKMYLNSEPVLLDNFIAELKCLDTGAKDVANFDCT